ncbi:hypothetical protein FB389_0331 [Rarobacter incanus]|uniref:AP2-like DNA-binding integrase family protein n=1 Tax=Rarobacter incanus TaxID=153494 RepID=A0A542SMA1_9MICO|nr:hypothetical protein FB389_0331 [Rarobacter incanus]
MARPRTPNGAFGIIATRRTDGGRHITRTRYRDWDGKSRHVQVTGATRPGAERALQNKFSERGICSIPGSRG